MLERPRKASRRSCAVFPSRIPVVFTHTAWVPTTQPSTLPDDDRQGAPATGWRAEPRQAHQLSSSPHSHHPCFVPFSLQEWLWPLGPLPPDDPQCESGAAAPTFSRLQTFLGTLDGETSSEAIRLFTPPPATAAAATEDCSELRCCAAAKLRKRTVWKKRPTASTERSWKLQRRRHGRAPMAAE